MNNRSLPLRYAALISCTLVSGLLLSGCGKKPATPAQGGPGSGPPPEVSVVTVASESITLTTESPGRLDAHRVAEVRARVPGILLERLFREGADVKAGDVLLQIDPAPLQAVVNSAKAALVKAEANRRQSKSKADRYEALVKVNAVSKQDYDDAIAEAAQADAEVLVAQAALEAANLNLGYATVTAPITGRIGKAKVTEGALVGQNEATPLATIQQLDPLYFDFTQSSTEVLKLRRLMEKGQLQSVAPGEAKVTLVLDDGSVYPHPGKLLFSDVTVDPTTSMITLRALFPNPEHLLLPGMFARGRLEQAVESQAITVPQRAVTRGPGGDATVMTVNAENKVVPRVVQTQGAQGDKWIVSSGLQPGERVIVEGLLKATPGAVVVPVPFKENAPSNTARASL